MDLLLIGGVSGSGKSVALAALEDSGYYSVNNLPPSLLADTAAYLARSGQERVAVALDVKTGPGLPGLADAIDVTRRAGWTVRFPLPRRQDRHAGQALFGNPPQAPVFEQRAHADRSHRVRTGAARRRPRTGLRLRYQRPFRGGAARLDQGFHFRRSFQAHAAVRVVRIQARCPAGCGPGIRRPVPAQSPLRARTRAVDRQGRARRQVPGGVSQGRANVWRHPPFRRQLVA